VLVRGWDDLTAYDLHSGAVQWTRPLKYHGEHLVASLVTDEARIYLVDTEKVLALDFDAQQGRPNEVAWSVSLTGEKISTPVLTGGHLFGITEAGQAFCIDTFDGALKWKHKLRGRFFASVVASGYSVLFASESGDLTVTARSADFARRAEYALREEVRATPVPLANGFLVRTVKNLSYISLPGGSP
jgi:outer membrane protein assembly factor BamB